MDKPIALFAPRGPMVTQLLFVPALEMIREVLKDEPDLCLDLEAGMTVRTSRRRRLPIGEGRPAVRRGLRYIKVPSLWEAAFELASHFTPPLDRKPLCRKRHCCPQLALAAGIVAKNWLRQLELPMGIEWLEPDCETSLILDPASGVWNRKRPRS